MKKFVKRFTLIVMAACMVFTGFTFAGCGETVDTSGIVEEAAPDMIVLERWGNTAGYSLSSFNSITVHGEENVDFVFHDEGGHLRPLLSPGSYEYYVIGTGEDVHWIYEYDNSSSFPSEATIEVKLIGRDRKNWGKFLGYAVIGIRKTANSDYTATVLKAATFPMTDGAYQDVTEEQVDALIENAKQLS